MTFNSVQKLSPYDNNVIVFFFFLIMVWNYYFISVRWLPPLRINKVKVKVTVTVC